MASYKVPQDVEAEDKLLGPFTFRQFIYLIIVAMCIAVAWGLSRLFIGLAIIPLPIILFFSALALPLKKDQPMEIYLAAIVSFFLKPRLRMWEAGGTESLIDISAPVVIENQLTKDISQTEAERRFNYLADIVDSEGWAIRGATNNVSAPVNNDLFIEAQGATDILDENTSQAHNFDQMMTQSTERLKQEARNLMYQTVAPNNINNSNTNIQGDNLTSNVSAVNTPPANIYPASVSPINSPGNVNNPNPVYNPYPNFNQSVIQPLDNHTWQQTNNTTIIKEAEKPISTSDTPINADIINLANNSEDLSIETIAHEANRLKKLSEEDSDDEVIISLR